MYIWMEFLTASKANSFVKWTAKGASKLRERVQIIDSKKDYLLYVLYRYR